MRAPTVQNAGMGRLAEGSVPAHPAVLHRRMGPEHAPSEAVVDLTCGTVEHRGLGVVQPAVSAVLAYLARALVAACSTRVGNGAP